MIGLNGYPCNKGLIVTLNGTNQLSYSEPPAFLTLGFALSHPLLCNFFGPSTLVASATPNQDALSFEFMVSRAPHNSDLKGLMSRRNIETGLSETNLAINFAKI